MLGLGSSGGTLNRILCRSFVKKIKSSILAKFSPKHDLLPKELKTYIFIILYFKPQEFCFKFLASGGVILFCSGYNLTMYHVSRTPRINTHLLPDAGGGGGGRVQINP